MYRKITQAIIISILSALIFTIAASAQNIDDKRPPLVYDGVETTAGTLDEISSVRYGNTFILRSNGKFNSRYLTVSINHRAMFKGVGVTGGAWSLEIFDETGGYTGTIYGDVVSGDIQDLLDDKGNVIGKETQINLVATGGTGDFTNEELGKIFGNIQLLTASGTKETKGLMYLNF